MCPCERLLRGRDEEGQQRQRWARRGRGGSRPWGSRCVVAAARVGGGGGVLVFAGSTSVVVAAGVQSQHNAAKARQAFVSASAQVALTLKLAIQHEQDLTVSAGAFIASNPHATNRQFVAWTAAERAFSVIPRSSVWRVWCWCVHRSLPRSRRRLSAVRRAGRSASGRFQLLPPGERAFYCFIVGQVSRSARVYLPGGL